MPAAAADAGPRAKTIEPARREPALKHDEARAGLLMLFAATLFAIANTMVPVLAGVASPLQILVVANVFAVLLAIPWIGRRLFARPRAPRLLGVSMALSGLANVLWFEALARTNLSLATALSFAAPLLATPIAALLLGERVTRARWVAVLSGFLGTLVVLRPWQGEFGPGTWFVVAATASFVGLYVTLRLLAGYEHPVRAAAAMSLGQVLVGLPLLVFAWQPLSWQALASLALVGVLLQTARVAMQHAYGLGRASVVIPMDFLRLPTIAVVAWIWIGQVPDIWTFAGALMIIAATVALARL